MTETNVLPLHQPGTFDDPLTDVLRNGARALLAQAVEAEVASLLLRGVSARLRRTSCALGSKHRRQSGGVQRRTGSNVTQPVHKNANSM